MIRQLLISTAVITIALLSLPFPGCATNPATGRKELLLVSDRAANEMGKKAYPQVRQEWGGDFTDHELAEYISEVGERLASVSESPELPYVFKVTNSSAVNAVTLPGGKIFITRGMLEQMENESQLAAVLGHEVGHAVARHGQRAMTWTIVVQTAAIVAATATDSGNDTNYAAIRAGMVAANLIRLGYSRKQELQADELGIDYMLKAGYHSDGAIQIQETLAKKEKKKPGLFGSLTRSHPVSAERVSHVKWYAYSHEAGSGIYRRGDGFFKERFMEKTIKARRAGKAAKHGDAAKKRLREKNMERAAQEIEKAVEIDPGQAEFFIVKGDIAAANRDLAAARAAYRKAAELAPDYYKPYARLGRMAAMQKKTDETIRQHKRALSLHAGHADSYIESGYAHMEKHDYQKAVRMLESGTGINPNNARAYTALGLSYEKTGRPNEAYRSYRRAVEIAPYDDSTALARRRLDYFNSVLQKKGR